MIQVKNLSKSFGSTQAVSDLSFSLQKGKTTALVGPNGAGKTTALHMLSGLTTPSSGTIVYEASISDPRTIIGFLPQYPAFLNWMTPEEYLHFVAQLGKKTRKEAAALTEELLERVGLKEFRRKKIGGFSGGMKQRLGIAQALVHQPKLLLLDEPVSALDPTGRKEVMELLKELKNESLTILYSTHVLHDAQMLCDDVLIMNKGEKVVFDSLDSVYKQFDRPQLVVKAEEPLEKWAKELVIAHPQWSVSVEQNSAVVTGASIQELRAGVLRELLTKSISVRSIEVGTTTLEDVFHEVMKK
ncbi:ABC transporter ATP-binding protein [Jeotgalibacillus proteolyticus]|uniref:ABC transporter ATP-binding protein n=1 Tax=Jeotgalibacillus proteolyticus TaxID=2082395 RepID=A0A2S5G658_9BACL|nr:ABC transporter ATP-binding protein [Jeotgalibacillus proteolyticus]PPA68457.1 ABC transporter ATP-binding protein [Jeotgalibacillus proteolyticus]